MKKNAIKKIIIFIFLIICIICLFYSIFNIVKWNLENNKTKKINESIKEKIIVDEKPINEKISILDRYYIDFEELKKINSDVVGYLKVDNTNIDSTVVKYNDNDFYLRHTFDKTWNSAGWLFSHYKNKYDGTDKHYVIFGHARKDGSMFGTLKNVLSDEWQNGNNKIIYITENSKSLYQVFSIYKVKAEDYYIQTDFKSNEEFGSFIDVIKSRSIKNFNIEVTTDDRLLTLSTCDHHDNKYRIVLHAKELK